jgi:hypothetical protein
VDLANPIYGPPDLPFASAPVGEENSYEIIPTTNELPVQESGAYARAGRPSALGCCPMIVGTSRRIGAVGH